MSVANLRRLAPAPAPAAKALLALALTALLALASAAPASAGQTPLRGAQVHSLWWSSSIEDMDRELDLLRDAGANAVRVDISWSSLETNGKGRFSDWYVEKTDTFLQHARDRGLKVIGTFWSTPCWASSAPAELKQDCQGEWWDREVDRYAPSNSADYADAAAWAARRWGSQLEALEIWNEPNLHDQYSLRAPDPAAAYADILKTAYPKVKEAAPGLTVLGGVLAFSDGDFLERLYSLGVAGHFDALSIHPYNEWRDPDDAWKPEWKAYTFLTGIPWIYAIMTAHGDAGKDLWLSELGFSTCGQGSRWCVSEGQQAEYIRDSFRIAERWSFVKAAIVYNLRNKGTDPQDRESQFGMVRRDFTPKPAYAAFKEALGGNYGAAAGSGQGDSPSGDPAQPQGEIELSFSGFAELRVSCPGDATCTGTVKLETRRAKSKRAGKARKRAGKARKRAKSRRSRARGARRLRLGTRAFRIPARRTGVVRVRLSRRSRRVLTGLRRVRVTTTAIARDRRGNAKRARRSFLVSGARAARAQA